MDISECRSAQLKSKFTNDFVFASVLLNIIFRESVGVEKKDLSRSWFQIRGSRHLFTSTRTLQHRIIPYSCHQLKKKRNRNPSFHHAHNESNFFLFHQNSPEPHALRCATENSDHNFANWQFVHRNGRVRDDTRIYCNAIAADGSIDFHECR